MGRLVDCAWLVGTAEIAERLGVKRLQVVHDWIRRHDDFPAPVAVVGNARIWAWPDVEDWAKKTHRIDR